MRSTSHFPASPFPRRSTGMLMAVAAVAALTACGASAATPATPASRAGSGERAATGVRVLWMGDSIAGTQAPALEAALTAAGARFKDATSDGGGTVVAGDHPVTVMAAKDSWKRLKDDLRSFRPTVIAYQITTYDWGTPGEQLAAYRRLTRTAKDAGARLVLVTAPPFKLDEFYLPHEKAIENAPGMAAKAAGAGFLDAAELWGRDHTADQAKRAKDGIHSCQQGSAAFATWFTARLGRLAGFTPADPGTWATGSWTADERFVKLGCG
ncbi:SGNH/GDSL hydrolase family protein [Nonomuraea sp. NN258]|uniref:SGNH/GDSL hydrolase family protein n=1 Tax=Nonomuraea antri TaxID=2730852 RepID=UPI0015691555|nr:SGNH/GDSL hydrolase family protein [Nonomuraea antri]NRQ35500.1 SGNH/GDSL hydrolase family protein [Nonomuraea antri]